MKGDGAVKTILIIHLKLMRLWPRVIASVASGNDEAYENVIADIEALHSGRPE
jgi:hypothetical protein